MLDKTPMSSGFVGLLRPFGEFYCFVSPISAGRDKPNRVLVFGKTDGGGWEPLRLLNPQRTKPGSGLVDFLPRVAFEINGACAQTWGMGGGVMSVEVMTTEQLIREVERWVAGYEADFGAMKGATEDDAILAYETIATVNALLDRLRVCQFRPMQSICVLSLQAIMQGPEYIERMMGALDALLSGQCMLVPSANMQALMGAPAGRA